MYRISYHKHRKVSLLQHQAAHKGKNEEGVAVVERDCSKICAYFSAKSPRHDGNTIFKKWCNLCKLHLVSRYWRCPCCHSQLIS